MVVQIYTVEKEVSRGNVDVENKSESSTLDLRRAITTTTTTNAYSYIG